METEAVELNEASKEWVRLLVLRIVSEQEETQKHLGAAPELLERMVRVEEALLQQQRYMDKHFEQIDKRLEQVDKRFEQIDKRLEQVDKRFEQVDKRFEQIDKRLEQVDKRFEDMYRYMDKRFEQVDKRFEDMQRYMDKRFAAQQWFMGVGFGLIIAILGLIKFAPL
ncbi:MAG: hypothetical protein AAF975_06345 [Spirochaetota bacterium]